MRLAGFLLFVLVQAPQPPAQQPTADNPNAPGPERDRNAVEMQTRTPAVSVSGSVRSEDRRPLPDDAWVQGYCNGSPGQGVFTRENFRILLTSPSGLSGPPGLTNTASGPAGCEVRVQLSGFFPAAVPVSPGSGVGSEMGTIVLRPRSDVSGYTYSLVSAMAPAEARKAYGRGVASSQKDKLSAASRELEHAVSVYPNYATAWFELGTVRHRQGDLAGARQAYQRSIDADALYLRPVLQMAMLAAGERNWPETLVLTERVLARNRFEFPQAFLYHAVAKYNLGDLATAEKSVRRAIELDAPHRLPKAFQLLSAICAQKQEYAEAAENLRLYLKYAPKDPKRPELEAQLADLEARAGGRKQGPPPRLPFSGG